jgi:hypothetical protein
MPNVTRNLRGSRSPSPSHLPRHDRLNIWAFLLCVLREPKTAREALRFGLVGGLVVVTLAMLGAIALIVRPAETQAIVGTLANLFGTGHP